MKVFSLIVTSLLLSSCGYMQQDCASLVGDRDEYRMCMATQGNQTAQYELGLAAYDAMDYAVAIDWLKRAARPKSTQDANYLAPDPKKRRELSFEEDERPKLPGHRGAQRLLVNIYEQGIGVPVNPEEAERYRKLINPQ